MVNAQRSGRSGGLRRKIASGLLDWYGRSRRDLPWRRNPTPYRVWISEVMLQQTRVEVVVPRYRRFLDRFPDLKALAKAREEEVLAEWSGLGYYGRARSLHASARAILRDHGGEIPRDPGILRKLPGFGPYTVGAVLSIAFNLPFPILDGNVARVLARLFGIRGDPRRGSASRALRSLAEELIPEGKASDFNQALMELGALVCIPGSPRCPACPLRASCSARKEGLQDRLPEIAPRRSAEEVFLAAAAVVSSRGNHLLERRGRDGAPYLRGLWGFPAIESRPGEGERDLKRHLSDLLGVPVNARGSLGVLTHSITYRRITLEAFRFYLAGPAPRIGGALRDGSRFSWAPLERLGRELPASSLALKIKRVILHAAGELHGA